MSEPDWAEEKARDVLARGYWACHPMATSRTSQPQRQCDCDMGAVDGCKARVDAIATALRAAASEAREAALREAIGLAEAMARGIEERKGADLTDRVIYGAGAAVATSIGAAIASRLEGGEPAEPAKDARGAGRD